MAADIRNEVLLQTPEHEARLAVTSEWDVIYGDSVISIPTTDHAVVADGLIACRNQVTTTDVLRKGLPPQFSCYGEPPYILTAQFYKVLKWWRMPNPAGLQQHIFSGGTGGSARILFATDVREPATVLAIVDHYYRTNPMASANLVRNRIALQLDSRYTKK